MTDQSPFEGFSGTIWPVSFWALGATALSVVGVGAVLESLPASVGVPAGFAAYLSVAVSAALTLAAGVVMAVVAAGMLWWIDEEVPAITVLWAVAQAYWLFGLYTWVAAGYLVLEPPTALSMNDLSTSAGLIPTLERQGPLATILALRTPTTGLAIAAAWVALARRVRPLSALLGISAGVAVVAFLLASLSRLAAIHPL
jgi:hypothetical protein